MKYYPAFICEKGHAVSTSLSACNAKFCNCGAKIISNCTFCGSLIRGRPVDTYIPVSYEVPAYCPQCGRPFPWTTLAIESTVLALKEAKTLSDTDIQLLVEILPDAMVQTPQTPLAAVRILNAISAGGKFVASCLNQFVRDHGCELLWDLLNQK